MNYPIHRVHSFFSIRFFPFKRSSLQESSFITKLSPPYSAFLLFVIFIFGSSVSAQGLSQEDLNILNEVGNRKRSGQVKPSPKTSREDFQTPLKKTNEFPPHQEKKGNFLKRIKHEDDRGPSSHRN